MDRLGILVVIAPARGAGDPCSNPGPGENSSLKLLIFKLTSKYKPIVYALKNYNLNPTEKFEPKPGFEPRTSIALLSRGRLNLYLN